MIIKAERRQQSVIVTIGDEVFTLRGGDNLWRVIATLINFINPDADTLLEQNKSLIGIIRSNHDNFRRMHEMHKQLMGIIKDRCGLDVDISTMH